MKYRKEIDGVFTHYSLKIACGNKILTSDLLFSRYEMTQGRQYVARRLKYERKILREDAKTQLSRGNHDV